MQIEFEIACERGVGCGQERRFVRAGQRIDGDIECPEISTADGDGSTVSDRVAKLEREHGLCRGWHEGHRQEHHREGTNHGSIRRHLAPRFGPRLIAE